MRIDYLRFSRLVVIILLLNIVGAQLLHEAGHWAVLEAYGRRPLWGITSMVQLWDREPATPDQWATFTDPEGDQGWLHMATAPQSDSEMLVFVVAGLVVQLVAVIAGFAIACYGRTPAGRTIGFLLALVNAFSGFFYQFVSQLRGVGGDERLIGYYLDVSPRLISAVFGLAFGAGLFFALRALENRRTRLRWLGALFLGVIPVGPLFMIANGVVIEQVDAGNPLFRSVLGWSLPVFVTGVVCLLLLGLIAYRWEGASSGAVAPA